VPRSAPRTLLEAVEDLAYRLQAGGVRAVFDLRDLNPPAAIISPPTMHWRLMDGTWSADWTLWAVVPNSGSRNDLVNLDQLVEQIRTALKGEPVMATPQTLAVDGQSDPLPGYVLTWTE
jgi:hypothetical protein